MEICKTRKCRKRQITDGINKILQNFLLKKQKMENNFEKSQNFYPQIIPFHKGVWYNK